MVVPQEATTRRTLHLLLARGGALLGRSRVDGRVDLVDFLLGEGLRLGLEPVYDGFRVGHGVVGALLAEPDDTLSQAAVVLEHQTDEDPLVVGLLEDDGARLGVGFTGIVQLIWVIGPVADGVGVVGGVVAVRVWAWAWAWA